MSGNASSAAVEYGYDVNAEFVKDEIVASSAAEPDWRRGVIVKVEIKINAHNNAPHVLRTKGYVFGLSGE